MRDTEKKPLYFERKYRSIKRKVLWNIVQNQYGIILVSEYPKSGGTWFAKMIAECMGLPFPRNNMPVKFEKCVLHGHVGFSERYKKPLHVIRDGRDVAVSAYFHFLFENEWNIPEFVAENRKKLNFRDLNDVENNMAQFIKYLFDDYGTSLGHYSWPEFIRQWYRNDVFQVKYEELLIQPNEAVIKALEFLDFSCSKDKIQQIVEKNSFANVSRKDNQASFVRKGISGDWKNYFNTEAKDIFKKYANDELIMLGYEQGEDW